MMIEIPSINTVMHFPECTNWLMCHSFQLDSNFWGIRFGFLLYFPDVFHHCLVAARSSLTVLNFLSLHQSCGEFWIKWVRGWSFCLGVGCYGLAFGLMLLHLYSFRRYVPHVNKVYRVITLRHEKERKVWERFWCASNRRVMIMLYGRLVGSSALSSKT